MKASKLPSLLMDRKLGEGHREGNMDQLVVLGEGKRGLSHAGGSTALVETK